MLDASSLVQVNQGSTGSVSSTAFNMTLGSSTTDGNAVMAILLGDPAPVDPTGFTKMVSTGINVNLVSGWVYGRDTPGGETSFAVTMTSGAAVWYIAEIAGLASVQLRDPVYLTVMAQDLAVSSFSGTIGGSSASSNHNVGAPSQAGDLAAYTFAYCAVNSGTPPLLTGTPTHPADAGISWTRTGSTVATSRAAGVNIRLDVFCTFGAGMVHTYDSTFAWASAPEEIYAEVDGWKSYDVVAQQTRGRASTNSTN